MRRTMILGALAFVAALLVPAGTEAQEAGAPASRPPESTEGQAAPPRVAYEASLTRGGFIEFGARLNRRPNSTSTCRTMTFPTNGFRSCTWESLDFQTGESFFPPLGRGRITQVRIRVGNATGPMRIVVLQALRRASDNRYACCTAIRQTGTFTPRRNAVTTLNVNLPVVQSRRPTAAGYYIDQHLALSALGGNVRIPANIDPTASMSGWYPRMLNNQTRCCPYGRTGRMILMRARWRPA